MHNAVRSDSVPGIGHVGVRDFRCETCGPVLAQKLEHVLKTLSPAVPSHVLKCSHVGGHRLAANVIVYPGLHP